MTIKHAKLNFFQISKIQNLFSCRQRNFNFGSKMTSRKPYSVRPDHSVLRPSIEVSKTGMKQALHAMACGSKEV